MLLSPSKPWSISYEPSFGASVPTYAAGISRSVGHTFVPLTLVIFDAGPLALVCNLCTLLRVIWTALYGLAGLRIAQYHRPCAASKEN